MPSLALIESFIAVAVGLVTLILTVPQLKKVFAFAAKYRAATSMREGIQRAAASYNTAIAALNRLVTELPVARALVLKAHNGGGMITPSSQLKVTCRHEMWTAGLPSVKDAFTDFSVDAPYVAMLNRLSAETFLELHVEDMPAGWLRDLYESQDVKTGYLCACGYSNRGFYYIACQALGRPADTAKIRSALRMEASRIASAFDLAVTPIIDESIK